MKDFNDVIRAERDAYEKAGRNRGFKKDQTIEQRIKQGKSYLKSPRFFNTAVGACLAAAASSALAQAQGALEVAANSNHFRNGIQQLADGNLAGAQKEFLGDPPGGGFFGDLVDKGFEKAALVFEDAYLEAQKKAMENVKKCCGK